MRPALQALRSEAGEAMVLQDNFFVEKILPGAILRKLSDEEMAQYRRPFAEPGEGRRPTLTWPREIPIEGDPADVTAIVTAYADWLETSDVPKLFLKAEPGAILASDTVARPRPQVARADREDGRGDPFRPGRFAGRDRSGHRRLDGSVGLTAAIFPWSCPGLSRASTSLFPRPRGSRRWPGRAPAMTAQPYVSPGAAQHAAKRSGALQTRDLHKLRERRAEPRRSRTSGAPLRAAPHPGNARKYIVTCNGYDVLTIVPEIDT